MEQRRASTEQTTETPTVQPALEEADRTTMSSSELPPTSPEPNVTAESKQEESQQQKTSANVDSTEKNSSEVSGDDTKKEELPRPEESKQNLTLDEGQKMETDKHDSQQQEQKIEQPATEPPFGEQSSEKDLNASPTTPAMKGEVTSVETTISVQSSSPEKEISDKKCDVSPEAQSLQQVVSSPEAESHVTVLSSSSEQQEQERDKEEQEHTQEGQEQTQDQQDSQPPSHLYSANHPNFTDPKDINYSTERYEALMKESRTKDFREYEKQRMILTGKRDKSNRPVAFVIGENLPKMTNETITDVLSYLLVKLEPLVEEEYTLVYVHGARAALPPLAFATTLHRLLPRRYKKRLGELHIVYPTFMIRTLIRLMRPFVSTKVWKKIHFHNSGLTLANDVAAPPKEAFCAADYAAHPLFGVPLSSVALSPSVIGNEMVEMPSLKESLKGSKKPILCRTFPSFLPSAGCRVAHSLAVTGLFRLSPQRERLDLLRQRVDRGEDVCMENEDPHLAAGLINLSEPLIPFEIGDKIIEKINNGCKAEDEEIKALLLTLPDINDAYLCFFIDLLVKVFRHSDKNLMDVSALSTVAAPLVLRVCSADPHAQLCSVRPAMAVTTMLILLRDTFLEHEAV